MASISKEELERVWRDLELRLKGVGPIVRESRSYVYTVIAAQVSVYSELRNFIPDAPHEVWRKVFVTARNLGLPVSTVLGDLVVKALSEDPAELVEYRLSFCDKMLREGEELLSKGDIIQASEKFWNAVVQAIKAVAAREGIEIHKHSELWDYVSKLAEKVNDREIAELFANTNYLHKNFYEGNIPAYLLQKYIGDARKLISRLKELIKKFRG